MLLVGYGTTAKGEQYWILKNRWVSETQEVQSKGGRLTFVSPHSYGESWGEKGYLRIARNRGNHCGVASDATYPLM